MSENPLTVAGESSSRIEAAQPAGQNALAAFAPSTMQQAVSLAEVMAQGKLVPDHLRASPADCLMVIEQAMRWGMSPFAVAQSTSVVRGKLMFEGKLVAAVINSSRALNGRLSFEFSGQGDARTVRVSGRIRGEGESRTVDVCIKDVRTENGNWTKQPDQQLVYSGSRMWARRHVPELMLGVYTPEEMDELPPAAEEGPDPHTKPHYAPPAFYSDKDFESNLPKWTALIKNGKKTAAQVIATVTSKAQLSDEQCKKIEAISRKPPEPAVQESNEQQNQEWLKQNE